MSRIGGILFFKVDGVQYDAKGEFTYRLNPDKKEMVPGADRIHGHVVNPQVQFIEGAITDSSSIDLQVLFALEDSTVTLNLANGKTVVLRNAVFAGEGDATTSEGEVAVRFEGLSGEVIPA